jgi:hypothetical protein
MPYLNDELREWIGLQLKALGVEEIAIFALECGPQDEERRVLAATEVGLWDGLYAPRGSTARYALRSTLHAWQAVRGVRLDAETFRLWALEHQTRWHLRIHHPGFEVTIDDPELGSALADFAKVCLVMAEPAGWQAPEEESNLGGRPPVKE